MNGRRIVPYLALSMFLITGAAGAHMGENHDDPATTSRGSIQLVDSNDHSTSAKSPPIAETTAAKVAGFPTLHPLAVHFPIVLLPTGFLLLVAGLASKSNGVKYAGWGAAGVGTIGAWVASEILHVHAIGLTPQVADLFESHELWATITVAISTVGSVAGIVRAAWRNDKVRLVLDLSGSALFLAASIAVAVAGDKGASLTHIHGIGPMGHHILTD